MEKHDYPMVMNVKHVMEILDVSNRVAYELMKRKDFPVMSITGSKGAKRVPRDLFFKWLEDQSKGSELNEKAN